MDARKAAFLSWSGAKWELVGLAGNEMGKGLPVFFRSFGCYSYIHSIFGMVSKLAQSALWVAGGLTHVREIPPSSNRGPEVDEYLRNAGLNPVGQHYSWCMAFQYWIFTQAAINIGVVNPLFKTAGVLKQWNERPANRVSVHDVQPGDIGIIRHKDGVTGHTFIVESIQDDGLHTIEGNTNLDKSSNGIGVFRLIRKLTQPGLIGFLRF